jgi:hypothetical protein
MNRNTRNEPKKQEERGPVPGPNRRLSRLILMVTDEERETLRRIVEDSGSGQSVRRMLEEFVADMCNSSRRRWPYGREGARQWLEAHRGGLAMDRRFREGGDL